MSNLHYNLPTTTYQLPASLKLQRGKQPTIYVSPPLTISSIFSKLKNSKIIKPLPNEYAIIATGDVIPARSVNWKMTTKNNFKYPFEKTVDLLKSGDLLITNLEAPLVENCPVTNKGMIFCGNPKFIQGLKFAGVNIVNIANNHFENYGVEGIESTVNLLEKNNILVSGNNKVVIKQIKNKKFGFLGFNFIEGGKITEEEDIRSSILDLRKKADFVVVSFHWGDEYTDLPSQQQINIAHLAIETGADLILGNHPHWVQAMEIYKEKPIVYAHGNFIFDQMWSPETREGVVGKYIFDNRGVKDIIFYPIIIEDYSLPRHTSDIEAKKILEKMKKSSEEL